MRTLLLIGLIASGALACKGDSPAQTLSATDAARALENRNWMDLWPTSDREALHVYRFTPQMGGGVYQDRTLFAGAFELFNYEIGDGVIDIRWPHTKETESLRFTIERVKGPEPFDLRLSFEGNIRGPSVFFGRSSETTAMLSW